MPRLGAAQQDDFDLSRLGLVGKGHPDVDDNPDRLLPNLLESLVQANRHAFRGPRWNSNSSGGKADLSNFAFLEKELGSCMQLENAGVGRFTLATDL